MGQMNDKKRKENLEYLNIAIDATNTGIKQSQFQEELGLKREELKQRQEEFNTRRYEAEQAAIAAGLKFDLDKYLLGEIAKGGDNALSAKEYMRLRYGDKGAAAKPFDGPLEGQQTEKQNPAFRYQ